ncbi:MAG: Gfo/Idh/MocA family oxidoreductase [Pirellulaceae bacterium]
MSRLPSIRWGILGTARIASRVVGPAIRAAEGSQLAAIASRSPERAEAWAGEHGAERSYVGYEALLDDPAIDAVYIPLPPSLHAEWTIRAAERGKHVLCEKPLAPSLAEAEQMTAACRRHGVQFMDGQHWLHHPRTTDMRARILGGELGVVRRVTSAFAWNWDELVLDDLRMQRALGGGSLLDLGWYCVTAALWAFDAMPERVWATGRYVNDVDVSLSAVLWFPGDRVASFDCAFDLMLRKWFEIAGNRGSLVCDDFPRAWNIDKPRFWIHGGEGKASEHVAAPLVQEVCMIEAFTRGIRSGTLNEDWPRQAVDVQRVCDALDRAARSGSVVNL